MFDSSINISCQMSITRTLGKLHNGILFIIGYVEDNNESLSSRFGGEDTLLLRVGALCVWESLLKPPIYKIFIKKKEKPTNRRLHFNLMYVYNDFEILK